MRTQYLMVIPHSFSHLITATLGRSFQVRSNDPFSLSIKQDFILGVYVPLALMSVQCENYVYLSLGAALDGGLWGCWGSAPARDSSLWRRQKSREHPRLPAGIAANLLGSHSWSVPLSLSKGESSLSFQLAMHRGSV